MDLDGGSPRLSEEPGSRARSRSSSQPSRVTTQNDLIVQLQRDGSPTSETSLRPRDAFRNLSKRMTDSKLHVPGMRAREVPLFSELERVETLKAIDAKLANLELIPHQLKVAEDIFSQIHMITGTFAKLQDAIMRMQVSLAEGNMEKESECQYQRPNTPANSAPGSPRARDLVARETPRDSKEFRHSNSNSDDGPPRHSRTNSFVGMLHASATRQNARTGTTVSVASSGASYEGEPGKDLLKTLPLIGQRRPSQFSCAGSSLNGSRRPSFFDTNRMAGQASNSSRRPSNAVDPASVASAPPRDGEVKLPSIPQTKRMSFSMGRGPEQPNLMKRRHSLGSVRAARHENDRFPSKRTLGFECEQSPRQTQNGDLTEVNAKFESCSRAREYPKGFGELSVYTGPDDNKGQFESEEGERRLSKRETEGRKDVMQRRVSNVTDLSMRSEKSRNSKKTDESDPTEAGQSHYRKRVSTRFREIVAEQFDQFRKASSHALPETAFTNTNPSSSAVVDPANHSPAFSQHSLHTPDEEEDEDDTSECSEGESPPQIPHAVQRGSSEDRAGATSPLSRQITPKGNEDVARLGAGSSLSLDFGSCLQKEHSNLVVNAISSNSGAKRRSIETSSSVVNWILSGSETNKRGCFAIHPSSRLRLFWDGLVVAVTFFGSSYIPLKLVYYGASRSALTDGPFGSILYVCDAIWLIDILLNLCTGFYQAGRLIMDPRQIARRYFQSWFFFDLVAACPLELSANGGGFAWLLCWFKLIRVLRISRCFIHHHGLYGRKLMQGKTLLLIIILIHLLACFWRLSLRADQADIGDELVFIQAYVRDMYWVLATISTVGYGDITALGTCSQIFAILVMLTAPVYFGAIVSACTTATKYFFHDEVETRVAEATRFMRRRRLPMEVQRRVTMNLRHQLHEEHSFTLAPELFEALSPAVQRELQLGLLGGTVLTFPLFRGARHSFVAELAQAYTWVQCLQSDLVVEAGQLLLEVVFLVQARLLVQLGAGANLPTVDNGVPANEQFPTERTYEADEDRELELMTGAWFGEIALFDSFRIRSSTVTASQESELAVLLGSEYHKIIQKYPRLQEQHRHIENAIEKGVLNMTDLAYKAPETKRRGASKKMNRRMSWRLFDPEVEKVTSGFFINEASPAGGDNVVYRNNARASTAPAGLEFDSIAFKEPTLSLGCGNISVVRRDTT